MSKRKISKRQASRIQKAQTEHLSGASEGAMGLVVAHYYNYVDVESSDGQYYRCQLRQHLGGVVAGDRVLWTKGQDHSGVVTAIAARRSVLGKPDKQGKLKAIAANIDQLIIVAAPKPAPSMFLLDSYLVVAELLKMKPVLLINKIDLLSSDDQAYFDEMLKIYQGLGYTMIHSSTVTTHGLDQLKLLLKGTTSIFVGQSGVGKSSLVNVLLPNVEIRVGAISEKSELGTHTTTTARLYHLAEGGDIIDSPGVREFRLWHLSADQISRGFIEFHPYFGQCQFRNCRHQTETHCAILAALKEGKINRSRLENYWQLLKKMGGS